MNDSLYGYRCAVVLAEQPLTIRTAFDLLPAFAFGVSATLPLGILIFRNRHLALVREHEVAVVPQPRPLFFLVGERALGDFGAAVVVHMILNQVARAGIGREEVVAVVEIQDVEVPLHRRLLSDF